MRRYWFPKRYADTVARLRVPSGFLLVAAFAYFSHPTPAALAAGVPVSLAGLALRAWAAGHLAKNQSLATGGPYTYTRNPLYLGTLLVACGLAVASCSPGLGALFAAVFLLVYLPVIEQEEQHLRKIFPGYSEYADKVPALWPGLAAKYGRSPNRFQLALYLKNQEYQAAGGFLIGLLFLLWKIL
jgi:protein-S-isoprenylcysteine O-methyltransferase Ste14